MYESSFRLRGKTYDYKIQYEHIKKFMVLPKPDELHTLISIGLDPPLRQGQTRYPFLVMQFKREEEVSIELNMTEYARNRIRNRKVCWWHHRELLEGKYKGKLLSHYESPQHSVVAQVFRGLSGKKVVTPSKDFVRHVLPDQIQDQLLTFIVITNNPGLSVALKPTRDICSALIKASCLCQNRPPISPLIIYRSSWCRG